MKPTNKKAHTIKLYVKIEDQGEAFASFITLNPKNQGLQEMSQYAETLVYALLDSLYGKKDE